MVPSGPGRPLGRVETCDTPDPVYFLMKIFKMKSCQRSGCEA
jgi:hypothetical protein